MKKINVLFLTVLLVFFCGSNLFFSCSDDSLVIPKIEQGDEAITAMKNAKKPSPNLIGTMDLTFNFVNPVWVGTINLEGYGEYGLRFFHLSPFKGYSQADPFEEYFEIYDLLDENKVYLAGPDVGVTTLANKPPEPCKYRMNGEVEVANEPFEGWLGRKVHMSGIITWQNLGTSEEPIIVPATAPGTLRIN